MVTAFELTAGAAPDNVQPGQQVGCALGLTFTVT
jgi:hypothetical protein